MISLSTLSIFVIPRCYDKYVPGIVVVHRTLTSRPSKARKKPSY
jgi:hypothetical protein